MTSEERRRRLTELLRKSEKPLSGTVLAESCGVSRQIIVQDISALRQSGYSILSTARGYLMNRNPGVCKVLKVCHTDEQIEDELNRIVDLGGEVEDVFIYHKVYGEVRAKLCIYSRRDVQEFLKTLKTGTSSPLKNVTAGYHYHTICAKDEETLRLIENALWERGYLAQLREYEPQEIRKQ